MYAHLRIAAKIQKLRRVAVRIANEDDSTFPQNFTVTGKGQYDKSFDLFFEPQPTLSTIERKWGTEKVISTALEAAEFLEKETGCPVEIEANGIRFKCPDEKKKEKAKEVMAGVEPGRNDVEMYLSHFLTMKPREYTASEKVGILLEEVGCGPGEMSAGEEACGPEGMSAGEYAEPPDMGGGPNGEECECIELRDTGHIGYPAAPEPMPDPNCPKCGGFGVIY